MEFKCPVDELTVTLSSLDDSQADLKELEENQMPVTPTSFTPDPTQPTAGTDQDTDRRRAARSRIPPQRSTPDPERPSAIAFPPTLTQAQQDEFRARYPHGIPQTPSSTPRREITAEQRAQRQHMEELLEGKNVSYRQPSTNLNK